MLFNDTYKTISASAEGVYTDRGSKFIGYAFPLNNEKDIKTLLSDVQAHHPKARHHCWACRLTTDRSIFRLNDDGEPSGSAGRPMLSTLLSHDLTDILIVVVRYFGGTLLGIPGLINAYKMTSQKVLYAAEIVEKTINDIYRIEFNYLAMNDIMKVIKNEDLQIKNQQFDNNCSMEIAIRKSKINQAIEKLNKISSVSIKFLYTA